MERNTDQWLNDPQTKPGDKTMRFIRVVPSIEPTCKSDLVHKKYQCAFQKLMWSWATEPRCTGSPEKREGIKQHTYHWGKSTLRLQSTQNSPDSLDMSSEFWKCTAKGFDLAGQNVRQDNFKDNVPQIDVQQNITVISHITVKCPARIQNVRRRTGGLPDKMSGQAQTNFAYTGQIVPRPFLKICKRESPSSEFGLELFSPLEFGFLLEVHPPHSLVGPVSLLKAITSVLFSTLKTNFRDMEMKV